MIDRLVNKPFIEFLHMVTCISIRGIKYHCVWHNVHFYLATHLNYFLEEPE